GLWIRNERKNTRIVQKLEEIVLEDKISRRIKEVYAQQEEINESHIKPKKRKISHKRSKKREENKENLVHNDPLGSSIIPT
ncbi:23324_t:CDS:2, partial [Gigaspora rosea]